MTQSVETVGPFDTVYDFLAPHEIDKGHVSRVYFAYRGLAFELRIFKQRFVDSPRLYHVVLVTMGCCEADEYFYEDADDAVFGDRDSPVALIYDWTHAPDDAEGATEFVEYLLTVPQDLERIILENARPYLEALERFKAGVDNTNSM